MNIELSLFEITLLITFCLSLSTSLVRFTKGFVLFPTTFIHELSHLVIGFILGASPRRFSVIPKKSGDDYILGHVEFSRLNNFNAPLIAFSPLLGIFIGNAIIGHVSQLNLSLFEEIFFWIFICFFATSCLPSTTDIKVCLSYPIGTCCYIILILVWIDLFYTKGFVEGFVEVFF